MRKKENHKFKVNDYVKINHNYMIYTHYDVMAKLLGLTKWNMGKYPTNPSSLYRIISIKEHENKTDVCYGLELRVSKKQIKQYIADEKCLEFHHNDDSITNHENKIQELIPE